MAPGVHRNPWFLRGQKRYERHYNEAMKLIERGYTFRAAAAHNDRQLSVSGLHWRYKRRFQKQVDRTRTALTAKEEHLVIKVLQRYSSKGHPLTMKDLQDVEEALVSRFPSWRMQSIRFKHGRPGRKFCRLFLKRHFDEITLRQPRKEDAKRYLATNADVLVDHFQKLERIITENNIDPIRILNLDETGVSAWNEDVNQTKKKVFTSRYHNPMIPSARFRNVNRISIICCVHANGDAARPMFVFQGTRLRYRVTRHGSSSENHLQSISECLPRGSLVTVRKDVAAIDNLSFVRYVEHLIEDTADLRQGGRKMLLLYDGYRAHLSIPALELLSEAGIIAYALPAHTSGTTQPLDRCVFSGFKAGFRDLLNKLVAGNNVSRLELTEMDVCTVLTRAYEMSFTHANITKGFKVCGVSPLDDIALFAQARPFSAKETYRIASVDDMCNILDTRRRQVGESILGNVRVMESGFIDTEYGAVLKSNKAIGLMKQHVAARREERKRAEEALATKEVVLEAEKRKRHAERWAFEQHRVVVRHNLYGDVKKMPRSLAERRANARERSRRERVGSIEEPQRWL